MALDRFVCFTNEIPTLSQLQCILEDYLGGIGKIDYQEHCWFISLPGAPSFPFKRIVAEPNLQASLNAERWFEVYVGSISQTKENGMGPNIDVITRSADELTNTIAQGFAKAIARYYQAEIDE